MTNQKAACLTNPARHAQSETAIIYKIVDAASWRAAETSGLFDGSTDDRRDGFIHFSKADQLTGTLQKHFRHRDNLLLVAFEAARLAEHLRWEVSRNGELFPHLYAALAVAQALWVRPLITGTDGVPQVPPELL